MLVQFLQQPSLQKKKNTSKKNFGPDTYYDSECSILSDPEWGTLNDAGTIPKTAIEKECQSKNFDPDYYSDSECIKLSDSDFGILSDILIVPTTSFL